MRLPECLRPGDARSRLEMTEWLTNIGARIEDSDIFQREAPRFEQGVRWLAELAEPVSGALSVDAIAETILEVQGPDRADRFLAFATSCLILTGQSDNALKCQFPVFLTTGGYVEAQAFVGLAPPTLARPTLQTIGADRIARKIVRSGAGARELLVAYFECVFSRANSARMHQAIAAIKRLDGAEATSVLEVMALSAIRGSATASGGHLPEEQLRRQMEEWGLVRGEDFNSADVAAKELALLGGNRVTREFSETAQKSRAFDFVLPYRIAGRGARLLIQGQFYAGDSGSVSHKNVDQTPTGRRAAGEVVASPIFAEFLDGAGYVTALAGDAERLLTMQGTDGLIQLNTAAIRLRELLQRIQLATPLEVVHAAWQAWSGGLDETSGLLRERYGIDEAVRIVHRAAQLGWISIERNQITVTREKAEVALEYAVLDSIALVAETPGYTGQTEGVVIPGYGLSGWAVSPAEVLAKVRDLLPGLDADINGTLVAGLLDVLRRKQRIHVAGSAR